MKQKFDLRILFLVLCTIQFAACSSDDEPSESDIDVKDKTSLSQEIFADNTIIQNGVNFTTNAAWTSFISDITSTRSDSDVPDWISIDPASGDKAGNYTINIELTPNYTGSSRKARITIYCNNSKIEIFISQKETKEDGTEHGKLVRKIIHTSKWEANTDWHPYRTLNFQYNNKNKIEKFNIKYDPSHTGRGDEIDYIFSYPSDDKIAIHTNEYSPYEFLFELNADGYVKKMTMANRDSDHLRFLYDDAYIKEITHNSNEEGGTNFTSACFDWDKATGRLRTATVGLEYTDWRTFNYENYLETRINNVMNIDVNALANSERFKIYLSSFSGNILTMFDLLGKRSQNYLLDDLQAEFYSDGYENEEYLWVSKVIRGLNKYIIDSDGYVLTMEIKSILHTDKIEKSTGNIVLTEDLPRSEIYEFVYQ